MSAMMRGEISEIIMQMDMEVLEVQMALQCAPVLAGIKISNLLILRKSQLPSAMQLLRRLGVCFYILWCREETAVLLVYQGKKLIEYLQRTEVEVLLAGYGYSSMRLGTSLPKIALRYADYMERKEKFPHEMGLFLGYPPEDVKGFVQNGGRKYLCAGYWKVYGQADEKMRLFACYDAVTYQFLSVLSGGGTLPECVQEKSRANVDGIMDTAIEDNIIIARDGWNVYNINAETGKVEEYFKQPEED